MKNGGQLKTQDSKLYTLLRGELRVAGIGFAVLGILLGALGTSAWWAVRTQAESLERAKSEQLRVLGTTLAASAETMLANDELSSLRRIVVELAQKGEVEQCHIILPDGRVIAADKPSGITLLELPATWPETGQVRTTGGRWPSHMFPLDVPGRGSAALEIIGRSEPLVATSWQIQAGIGAISVAALLALMVLYRRVRSGLRGFWAVRQALLARERGQLAPEALKVDPRWGQEAKAWNNLLSQDEEGQKKRARERALKSLRARPRYEGDLAAACDALSQGLILVDKEQQARYANGAAAMLLRTKREEMLSADVASFIDDERVLEAVRLATAGPNQSRAIVEVQRDADGGGEVLRFVVRPARREDCALTMIVVEDITQQRVAEKARNAFLAQATHELRTPLTNIRMYAEMALEEGKDDPAVQAECLNVINQETFRLNRVVEDILSVSEIEAGTLTLKEDDVRMDELLNALEVGYAAQAQEKQIELVFDLPPKLPVLRGDKDKVAVALHNLVGNALKYTPASGKVRVTVATDDGRLVVEVSDTGIGIGPEDCERIFERFYRADDPRVADATGSGLGLAIARDVIRLHGGDITVESEPDRGSTFRMVLPVAEEMALA